MTPTRRTRQVALIRGINVGKAKRVPMAGLRSALGARGFENVATLLNSGNVVFDAAGEPADSARRVEAAIAEDFGVTARVLGLAAEDLAIAARENPLTEVADDASRLLLAFWLERSAGEALAPLLERDWAPERLAVGSRAAYLWCPHGILASRLVEEVGRTLGENTTTRNWRTVLKLNGLASSIGA